MLNLQVIKLAKIDQQLSTLSSQEKDKFHTASMLTMSLESRDIKSMLTSPSWSRIRSTVTSSSQSESKTQEPRTASSKFSVPSKSISTRALTKTLTLASERTTPCTQSSPTTSLQRSQQEAPSSLSCSLALSSAYSSCSSSRASLAPPWTRSPSSATSALGASCSCWTISAFTLSSSLSGSRSTWSTPCGPSWPSRSQRSSWWTRDWLQMAAMFLGSQGLSKLKTTEN